METSTSTSPHRSQETTIQEERLNTNQPLPETLQTRLTHLTNQIKIKKQVLTSLDLTLARTTSKTTLITQNPRTRIQRKTNQPRTRIPIQKTNQTTNTPHIPNTRKRPTNKTKPNITNTIPRIQTNQLRKTITQTQPPKTTTHIRNQETHHQHLPSPQTLTNIPTSPTPTTPPLPEGAFSFLYLLGGKHESAFVFSAIAVEARRAVLRQVG